MKAPLVGILFGLALCACSKKEEVKVLEAMRGYRIYDLNVGAALEAKQKSLSTQGVQTELNWSFNAESESEMVVTAELKVTKGKATNESFQWRLVRNDGKSAAKKHPVWDMKPLNNSARKLMNMDRSNLATWAGIVGSPSRKN